MAIKGESVSVDLTDNELLFSKWEQAVKSGTVDRKVRHIITGNLLQAFADFKGKLVSYTLMDGGIKKGILMPENWQPSEVSKGKVNVPIGKAFKVVASLTQGASISTNNGVTIGRMPNNYKIITAASRKAAGSIYLDEDILKLVDNHKFEMTSDKMVATLNTKHIKDFVNILQSKHGSSLTLSASQFDMIKGDLNAQGVRSKKPLPKAELIIEDTSAHNIYLLELEAEALELELELMEF